MAEVKRYDIERTSTSYMERFDSGSYVRYEDYESLEKERDELQKVVKGCASCCRELKCRAVKRRDYEQAHLWREAERAEIRKGK